MRTDRACGQKASGPCMLSIRRKSHDNDNNTSFTEFIAGQTANLLNPRNRGMSAAKRDNENATGGLLNSRICSPICMCCYCYRFVPLRQYTISSHYNRLQYIDDTSLSLSIHMYIYIYIHMCVYINQSIRIHVYIYIYIYICILGQGRRAAAEVAGAAGRQAAAKN